MSGVCTKRCSLLLAASIVWFAGCRDSADSGSAKNEGAPKQNEATEAEKCRSRLAGAIRRLRPESFAELSRREQATSGLNAWLASCAGSELMAMTVSDQTLAHLPASLKPVLTAPRFSVQDTQYIRDCLAMRALADSLAERHGRTGSGSDPETARIVSMFDWVVRNVSLMPEDEERVPLELFDVLLVGRGSADDRAWIFAEILRQREIDAVILRPLKDAGGNSVAVDESGVSESSDENDDSGDQEGPPVNASNDVLDRVEWLIAVVIGDRVMLFDPVAGLPVVGPLEPQLPGSSPAGLSVLEADPRWQQLSLQPISQTAGFCSRMFVLQEQLAAEDAAVFYEELAGGTTEIRPLLERVISAGGELFARATVEIWTYPDDRVQAAASRSEEEELAYSNLMKSFGAPFERKRKAEIPNIDELSRLPEELTAEEREELLATRLYEELSQALQSSDELFGLPSGRLKRARIRQVLGGDVSEVIQQLQQVRLASMETSVSFRVPAGLFPDGRQVHVVEMPPAIFEVNQSATGSSLYWTALAQIEQGQYGAAIATLQNYRRQHAEGEWAYASLLHEALAEYALGNVDATTARLSESNVPENPQQIQVQVLLRSLLKESPETDSQ